MKRTKPPFRADHVGSLLRPRSIHEARAKRAKGEITAPALKDIEDREIERVMRTQACTPSPTASSAARGGISISSGASTAPRSTSWTAALLLPGSTRETKAS